jgi:hypothetical protein
MERAGKRASEEKNRSVEKSWRGLYFGGGGGGLGVPVVS